MAGLGSENWHEIRQLRASESLGLADGPLQQPLWGPEAPRPQRGGCCGGCLSLVLLPAASLVLSFP